MTFPLAPWTLVIGRDLVSVLDGAQRSFFTIILRYAK